MKQEAVVNLMEALEDLFPDEWVFEMERQAAPPSATLRAWSSDEVRAADWLEQRRLLNEAQVAYALRFLPRWQRVLVNRWILKARADS